MHPNPVFRQVSDTTSLGFARARGFGVICVNADPAPLCSHIPFLLAEDGTRAEAHLVRSNPIAGLLGAGPVAARLIVSGADGYISPDWYQAKDQVPTWNYVAVHLTGELTAKPVELLRPHLDRLSAFFETRLLPKPIWRVDKVDDAALARMVRMILPVELSITNVEATWKLSQNKAAPARLAAADMVTDAALAEAMRVLPD